MAAVISGRARTIVWIGIVALVLAPFLGADLLGLFAYPGTYSQGVRVGQMLKMSEKGVIWKTWEGTLGVTQSGAYIQKWNFSVDQRDPQRDALVAALQRAQESGAIIDISYRQHYGIRRWHGNTSYSVTSVTTRP